MSCNLALKDQTWRVRSARSDGAGGQQRIHRSAAPLELFFEPRSSPRRIGYPLAAMLVLPAIALGEAVLAIGLLLAALVAARVLATTIGRSAERA